jgi:hypothetical protein
LSLATRDGKQSVVLPEEHTVKAFLVFVLGLASAAIVAASSTQIWEQKSVEDFEKGEARGVSITAEGRLQLSPQLDLLHDTGDPYVWALARDSRGRVFVGGGNEGKVYSVNPKASGGGSVFFKAPEIEVHALAVDARDHVYVGTSPDGKVYKVSPEGTSSVFFEPKTKYIWALAFDGKGNLYVATGDRGELFRVDPQGKGEVIYKSGDKHVRSLAAYREDSVVVGTEGRGQIVRISSDGQAFVLLDAGVREITSVAVSRDGSILAAGVGTAASGPPAAPGRSSQISVPSELTNVLERAGIQVGGDRPGPVSPSREAQNCEVYQIAADGYPKRIWRSDKVAAFSVAAAPDGSALVGSGNRGTLYQVGANSRGAGVVARAGGSQVTAILVEDQTGSVYVGTSNLGRLYRGESGYTKEGTFESQVKDAGIFSRWGRIRWRQDLPAGTSVQIHTRSGNTREPDSTWSSWSAAVTNAAGQQISSPAARFIQWKAVLATSKRDATPVVDNIELAYLPQNVAPEINAVTLQPRDIAIERLPLFQDPQALSPVSIIPDLQGLGSSSSAVSPQTPARPTPSRRSTRKGWQTVTWDARDENNDAMDYSVYVKGDEETEWKLLKERVEENFYSWDTTNFPDGAYSIRIVASDLPSNPPESALENNRISERFYIDNTGPVISGLTAVPQPGGRLQLRFKAADNATWLSKAEYGTNGGDLRLVFPIDGIFDSESEEFGTVVAGLAPGEHTIVIKVSDRANNQSSAKQIVTIK